MKADGSDAGTTVRSHRIGEIAMKSFAIVALAAALAPAAFAQHQAFVVNADASEVKIELKTTHELVTGRFTFNPDRLTLIAEPPGCRGRWWSSPEAERPAMTVATKR